MSLERKLYLVFICLTTKLSVILLTSFPQFAVRSMAPLQKSKSGTQTDQLQIQHFIHPHLLHKIYMTSEFNCDGCNINGHGVRYRCSPCDFDIHEQCAISAHRVSSHHHPYHQLVLVNRPGDSHLCHVCKGVTNGLSYTCENQACEFNVHTLCIQIPPDLGVNNQPVFAGYNGEHVMVNHQKQGMHTMQMGGYNAVHTSQPLVVNHQQKQGIATTAIDGYHGVNSNQTHMFNQQQQGIPMTGIGGNHLVNNSQPVTVNHQQKQGIAIQTHMINQQQGLPMTGFGGNHGVDNSQPVMTNHQPQILGVRVPTTVVGAYHGVNNNQTQMINHHHPQQQGVPAGFGGYHGGMNSQPMMANHHQQQQVIPMTSLSTNQQLMTNHHQQIQQQQQGIGIPLTAVGGYNVVNHNQTMMISHPPLPPPPPPPPQQSNGYTKVGKLAANILSTAFIGVPIFNPRN